MLTFVFTANFSFVQVRIVKVIRFQLKLIFKQKYFSYNILNDYYYSFTQISKITHTFWYKTLEIFLECFKVQISSYA